MNEDPQRVGASAPAPWVVILAAGDGRRLAELTRDASGRSVPKQYCSLRGGRSLLELALDRAGRVAPRERIVTVVAENHRRHWQRALDEWPRANVVVQPRNRGTAAGILLPLRAVLKRDPDAVVGVLPADHFVTDEKAFAGSLGRALGEAADGDHGHLVLLGVEAERAEPGLGWIVPRDAAGSLSATTVDAFVEKPPTDRAQALIRRGALCNSFAFAVRGSALLALLRRRLPELVERFEAVDAEAGPALAALYDELPATDFSSTVLTGLAEALRVLAVPRCGWMDLGTPERVARCLAELPAGAGGGVGSTVSLAAALERSLRSAPYDPLPRPPLSRASSLPAHR